MAKFKVNYSVEIDGSINNDKISKYAVVGVLGGAGAGTKIYPGDTKELT